MSINRRISRSVEVPIKPSNPRSKLRQALICSTVPRSWPKIPNLSVKQASHSSFTRHRKTQLILDRQEAVLVRTSRQFRPLRTRPGLSSFVSISVTTRKLGSKCRRKVYQRITSMQKGSSVTPSLQSRCWLHPTCLNTRGSTRTPDRPA